MDNKPLLSIVIANYNYGRFLEEAIQSVLSQSCQDFELIVVDGGSTDDSVNIIRKYEDRLAWWVSEKDKGQSDAFNKGFSHASGHFLTWLNADDVLLPDTIEKLKVAAMHNPGCEWFVGGCFWLDADMRIVNCGRARPFSEIRLGCGDVNGYGPCTFFTKRLLNSVGGVDIRFVYRMDSDLWLKFARTGARYLPFCNYAWGMRLHPAAKSSAHNYDENGKLIIGKAERKEGERHARQVDAEWNWMQSGYSVGRMTLFRRIVSASWCQVLAARFDLWRFRGKYYKDCCR